MYLGMLWVVDHSINSRVGDFVAGFKYVAYASHLKSPVVMLVPQPKRLD